MSEYHSYLGYFSLYNKTLHLSWNLLSSWYPISARKNSNLTICFSNSNKQQAMTQDFPFEYYRKDLINELPAVELNNRTVELRLHLNMVQQSTIIVFLTLNQNYKPFEIIHSFDLKQAHHRWLHPPCISIRLNKWAVTVVPY